MFDHCNDGVCVKCRAGKLIVIGLLVLAWNSIVSGTFIGKDWPTFIGAIFIIKGVLKLTVPSCGHCGSEKDASAAAKKKRR